jgi:hypothetical protein
MNRRTAFKNLVIASGGLITLPAWMQSCGISNTNTHHSSFSADEQSILAAITDTIIPAGNTIGALSVGVDKYLQKLLDDCYEKPAQDNFKKQLQALNNKAKAAYSSGFTACKPQQKKEALMKLASSSIKEEKEFYDLVKAETIHGFNTSQQVMEGYLNYKIAPGHYYGCVNVKA